MANDLQDELPQGGLSPTINNGIGAASKGLLWVELRIKHARQDAPKVFSYEVHIGQKKLIG